MCVSVCTAYVELSITLCILCVYWFWWFTGPFFNNTGILVVYDDMADVLEIQNISKSYLTASFDILPYVSCEDWI